MKTILVLGDIHANYPALKAIWNHVREYRFDRIINTGDLTVYGTFPNETIQWFCKRKKSICILGHSHTPYHKTIDGVHFINPGSVGRMFDGDPRAAFAMLKVCSGKIAPDLFRIPYPVEAVVAGLKQNRLPDIYARMYRLGRKLN
jgi:predicted phosphodiesterase